MTAKGKLWGGRFSEETDDIVNRVNASIDFDKRLYKEDIIGSIAHCKMLGLKGIIPVTEADLIIKALKEILNDIENNKIAFDGYEDIHGLVETLLIGKIGPVGKKLHTGRSRNDQIALDVRIFVKSAALRAVDLIDELRRSFVRLADKNIDVIMPGYTHLQRAQPVLASHHLLAYYEMFSRDRLRFVNCCSNADTMPLGSAALAGSTFNLDRNFVAEELGFSEISLNSMDAVSDRDFVLDYLYSACVLMMHLSRLGEELILWSSNEFNYISISDKFCTGSSIMPQKKNPDLPELIRGKTGRVYGNLIGLFTTMKGLPLAYNKDMQEDKEPLFDTVDTIEICLEVASRLLDEIKFNRDKTADAVNKGYLTATDLADYLTKKNLPFRDAHKIVGEMVVYAIKTGRELQELNLEEMKQFYNNIENDIYSWLDPVKTIEKRNLPGGTAPETVKKRIEQLKAELNI